MFLEGLRKTQNTRSQDYCQDTNPRLSGCKTGVLFTYSTVAFNYTLSHSRPVHELSPSLRNSNFILPLLLDSINDSLFIVIFFFLWVWFVVPWRNVRKYCWVLYLYTLCLWPVLACLLKFFLTNPVPFRTADFLAEFWNLSLSCYPLYRNVSCVLIIVSII